MIETILAIIAAMITIFIAGLLVRKQQKCDAIKEEMEKHNRDTIESIADEVTILIRESPVERSLTYLEARIETFNKTIKLVRKPGHGGGGGGGHKRVKHKKRFAND